MSIDHFVVVIYSCDLFDNMYLFAVVFLSLVYEGISLAGAQRRAALRAKLCNESGANLLFNK